MGQRQHPAHFLRVHLHAGRARPSARNLPLSRELASTASARGLARLLVGLRPEALRLAGDGIAARVEAVEVLGADAYVFCSAEIGGAETRITARADAREAPGRGEAVRLVAESCDAHLFDPGSGERLPS
jgi:multiple sugar transport system ATP-binding protein